MSDTELLQQISDKMDKLLRLQALTVVKDIPEEKGKIELLDSLGFRPVEIAKLLNKTPENINVVLSTIRKKKEEKKTQPFSKPPSAEKVDIEKTITFSTGETRTEENKK